MRCGNLPDAGLDKETWKRCRDLLTRHRDYVTPRYGRDVPHRRYRMFHLGLKGDVVETYQWDVMDTYRVEVVVCFIRDLFETSWKRTHGTLLLRPLETLSWHSSKTSWRRTTETSWGRSIETPLGVLFEKYLRRRSDAQREVITTLLICLLAG